ncbi:hypothetical protein HOY82DRAFT_649435 [Tuber indicum]|nr:hypothetical protein HOY82DRAFT_649435 [Tuber indicum]
MSDETVNVMVFPTNHLLPFPPHPDSLYAPLSDRDYRAARNLRSLYLLIHQICPGDHGHYANFPSIKDSLPDNYSAKVCCTGDGTSWRVVMSPEGIKGMIWYFCGLKRLDGVFKTAVIRYWNHEQCEAFVEALEIGGIQNLPRNWRFAAQRSEFVDASENLHTNFATLAIKPQEEDNNNTATGVSNGNNAAEAEQEISVHTL